MTLEETTKKLFLAEISLKEAKKDVLALKAVNRSQSGRISEVLALLSKGILNPKEANTEILNIWNRGR